MAHPSWFTSLIPIGLALGLASPAAAAGPPSGRDRGSVTLEPMSPAPMTPPAEPPPPPPSEPAASPAPTPAPTPADSKSEAKSAAESETKSKNCSIADDGRPGLLGLALLALALHGATTRRRR